MIYETPNKIIRAFLYGGGSTLLVIDVYFLLRALVAGNYVPIVPVIAGIFTAGGLMFVVYAEQQAREEDKRAHRRIARVAHQLISPLRVLEEDIAELLKQGNKLPPAERLKLKRMSTKSQVVLDNVRDVFLTLQAQEGSIVQDKQVYDLCDLVQEAKERIEPLASARNVTLQVKVRCSNARVKIDKRLFMIVLQHVLENSIYYTLTPGLVKVDVVKGNKYTRIIVFDRGIGINKKDAAMVWRPFARGEQADKYDPDGVGIGLALSKMIMRELHGKISYLKKSQRMGTQFDIILPLVRDKK